MTTTFQPKIFTLEEFLAMPETKPASEFILGSIESKPMPQGQHSRLQLKLCNLINDVAEATEIAMALPELRCTFGVRVTSPLANPLAEKSDKRSIVPDIAIFRWERIPFEPSGDISNAFELAPDWTIEILSPDQKDTKVIRNILHCLNHGTSLGWLIYPDERIILAFPANQNPVELSGSDRLPVLAELDLSITVDDVFGLLRSPVVRN
jgi:Uma2 family endonuclease